MVNKLPSICHFFSFGYKQSNAKWRLWLAIWIKKTKAGNKKDTTRYREQYGYESIFSLVSFTPLSEPLEIPEVFVTAKNKNLAYRIRY
jgi:hypothetical protein